MEPVEVLRDLSEVCRAAIAAGDWKVDGACDPDSLLRHADAAIAALSSPAGAHCTTCSCVPGMTPAVRFDTTPAEKEGAVRDHLIRMGWTPPAEAQPAPSAPVGVDWRAMYRFQTAMRYMDNNPKLTTQQADKMADDDVAGLEASIAQYPPAVDCILHDLSAQPGGSDNDD